MFEGTGPLAELPPVATDVAFVCATSVPLVSKYWNRGIPYVLLNPVPLAVIEPAVTFVNVGVGEKLIPIASARLTPRSVFIHVSFNTFVKEGPPGTYPTAPGVPAHPKKGVFDCQKRVQ